MALTSSTGSGAARAGDTERAYFRLTHAYLEWDLSRPDSLRDSYLGDLASRLEPADRVVELGCGTGELVAAFLVGTSRFTGVDRVASRLRRARQAVPDGSFVQADFTRLALRPGSLAAVVSLYALIHVPERALAPLLHAAGRWLRPGGLLVVALGSGCSVLGASPSAEISCLPRARQLAMIEAAGLTVERHDVSGLDTADGAVEFTWLAARRPPQAPAVTAPRSEPDEDQT
jgi:SAM-dependent methyltransferase